MAMLGASRSNVFEVNKKAIAATKSKIITPKNIKFGLPRLLIKIS